MNDDQEETLRDLAGRIDHTLLDPTATGEDVRELCAEARRFGFAGACVAGSWLPVVVEALQGSGVMAIAVAGFPLGTSPTVAKAFETEALVRSGADEIDTVIHLGHAKAGAWGAVRADLEAIIAAAGGRPVKAILETAVLTPDEIVRAAEVAVEAGAAFVKTSTGFGPGGATVETVRLLRETVGERARVKASGGIRTHEQALAMLAAGADRLGTSSSVAIVSGADG